MVYRRVLVLGLLFALAACEHKKEVAAAPQLPEKAGAETQVAAKVNGDEVSVQQVNYAMSRLGNIAQGREDEASRQLLRGLVDQQILVKQAVDQKLDQNPAVHQALEAARRQILVQASLEKMTPQLSQPTDAEIHEYYVKSPELFSNRRIYKFAQILITGTPDADKIKGLLKGTKNLDEFSVKLNKENIPFKAAAAVKPAEELPIALLPKFAKMEKGEVGLIPSADGLTILQLQDFKEQPLTESQAHAVIGNFLMEQKRKALLEAEVKKLHDAAKIEYFGPYADLNKAAVTSSSDQAASATNPGKP
ncbi:MAG: EpsD family peptidyl-prolyl cis-trans isomerase [Pseudomonadota bacterium]